MHYFMLFPVFLKCDEQLICYSEIRIDDPQWLCVQMELAFTDMLDKILYVVDKSYMPC
jgi:hypothetical protein